MQTQHRSNSAILELIADEWGSHLERFSYAQKTEALVILSHLLHTHSLADVQSHLLPRNFLLLLNQLTVKGLLGLVTAIAHQLRDDK
ncbi:hypothetical protein [Myxacorys almedinensis]|uniref:Uncharacterized protein n=1 Tax=Myxacorys almedinensis A TaxID=2690445 RepID=A0A8J7YY47_9CYAN|nr:hypothetical protein [Myxacorys almedinensis]NDJ16797.1 hypothetical protein [Myxacorys almedinensis A]